MNQSTTGLWLVGILAALAVIVGLVGVFQESPEGLATVEDIADLKTAIQSTQATDTSGLATKEDVKKVEDAANKLVEAGLKTEDEADDDKAEQLAWSELSEKENRAVFNFLNTHGHDVDDREDITSVTPEDPAKVNGNDGDFTVVQKVKVKFYDEGSDEVTRKFIWVKTVIDNWEVESQTLSW